MRTLALVKRLLSQFANDKRTVAFTLLAPILIFTLVYLINYGETKYDYNIGIVKAPIALREALERQDDKVKIFHLNGNYKNAMDENELVLVIDSDESLSNVNVLIDGSNYSKAQRAKYILNKAVVDIKRSKIVKIIKSVEKNKIDIDLNNPSIEYRYVYGYDSDSFFDKFGHMIIGILVFVFVYILAGINFLSERTSGTLEKMLTTPIRRREIIIGYVIAFSILASIQTLLISLYVIYVLKISIMGSVLSVVLVNLLTALVALSLGLLLSTVAKSEFQVIQFIPAVITPQIFLCGLFELSGVWNKISYLVPLKYTVSALNKVMLKGYSINMLKGDLIVLIAFFIAFMIINIRLLKKRRNL